MLKVNSINIGNEGVDNIVIKNLNFESFLPDAFLFENNHNSDGDSKVVRICTNMDTNIFSPAMARFVMHNLCNDLLLP